jgi:endonuclease-8
MPEGPSIVILKEEVQSFIGKRVLGVSGNTRLDLGYLKGKVVRDFRSWGKHFLICFDGTTVRIHFLLFGSYRVNEQKPGTPRLSFRFRNGELNLYACSVQVIEENPDKIYDWSADVMNDAWDSRKARKKLKENPQMLVCDALLDQQIFAGVGNIIKNEVLFRIRVQPESRVGALPPSRLTALIREARTYSFDFLRWKKAFELKKHWLAHTKSICPRCAIPFVKKYPGKTKRRSFFCINCQHLYK